MQIAYKNNVNVVQDIDPFTGGLSENAVEGGLVGETFACIIGLQFKSLKEGDRFFFTNPPNGVNHEMGLPKKAKEAIRNRKLGDIICDNIDVEIIANEVMRIGQENQNQTCKARNKLKYSDLIELFASTPAPSPAPTPAPSPAPSQAPTPAPTILTGNHL